MALLDDAFPFLYWVLQTFAKHPFRQRDRRGLFNRALPWHPPDHVHTDSQSHLVGGRACRYPEHSHDYQIAVSPGVLRRRNHHGLGDNSEQENAKVQN